MVNHLFNFKKEFKKEIMKGFEHVFEAEQMPIIHKLIKNKKSLNQLVERVEDKKEFKPHTFTKEIENLKKEIEEVLADSQKQNLTPGYTQNEIITIFGIIFMGFPIIFKEILGRDCPLKVIKDMQEVLDSD